MSNTLKKQLLNYEYSLVHKFRVKYYINDLCEYIGISRSGYYRWLMRIDIKTPRQETKETLKQLINNYHTIHPEKGYRAVRKDIFNDTGWIVSSYLMYQCFREMGIYSKARRRAFRRPKGVSDKFPNVIDGNWQTRRPFEKVCTDTTMIIHQKKKYDLNLHIDVFNNEIVGYDLANYHHGNGVMNHLRSLEDFLRIKEQRGYGEDHTILHSDQGRVYSSVKFEKTHQTYPITRSMSRAGTPTDNPVIESLIGWIKGDLKHYLKLHDFGDIKKAIEIYVDYFNHHRVAYRLDYLTPVRYRTIKGFNEISPLEAKLFFQLIDLRYTKRSTIFTSNITFDKWSNILGNDEMITKAILDRIIHHSYLFNITGPSYRLKDKLELNQTEEC